MPCNSDYMNPTRREIELQRAAKLLVYASERLGKIPPKYAIEDAAKIYCTRDKSVIELCNVLHNMDEEQMNSIVYDGHRKESRDLADWWEEHQEADRKREESEQKAKANRRKQWEKLNKEFGHE